MTQGRAEMTASELVREAQDTALAKDIARALGGANCDQDECELLRRLATALQASQTREAAKHEALGRCLSQPSDVSAMDLRMARASLRHIDQVARAALSATPAELLAEQAKVREVVEAATPIAEFINTRAGLKLPDNTPMTKGSLMARQQITAGQLKALLRALAALAPELSPEEKENA